MVNCSLCTCTKTIKTSELGITFHCFPKDAEQRKTWIEFLNKPSWKIPKNAFLCSQHFQEDFFDRSSKLKIQLKKNSVPSIHKVTYISKKKLPQSQTVEAVSETSTLEFRPMDVHTISEFSNVTSAITTSSERCPKVDMIAIKMDDYRKELIKIEDMKHEQPEINQTNYNKFQAVDRNESFIGENSMDISNSLDLHRKPDMTVELNIKQEVDEMEWKLSHEEIDIKTEIILNSLDQQNLVDGIVFPSKCEDNIDDSKSSDFKQTNPDVFEDLNIKQDKELKALHEEIDLKIGIIPNSSDQQDLVNGSILQSESRISHGCSTCNKIFNPGMTLNELMLIHYRDLKEHNLTDTGEKPFSCKSCNKSFLSKKQLKVHNITHMGEKLFSCKLCSKSFSQNGTLKSHMLRHTEERPFSCEVCKRLFKSNVYLKSHSLTHKEERPFSCKSCNKSYSTKGSFKVHMLTHREEKPFLCELCNKSFVTNYKLKVHMLSHTGEKPFLCKFCNKSFYTNAYLKRHNTTHTQ